MVADEARVLIEYVFSAALASERRNPAGFKQEWKAGREGWKGGIITEFQNFASGKFTSTSWEEDPQNEMSLQNKDQRRWIESLSVQRSCEGLQPDTWGRIH